MQFQWDDIRDLKTVHLSEETPFCHGIRSDSRTVRDSYFCVYPSEGIISPRDDYGSIITPREDYGSIITPLAEC